MKGITWAELTKGAITVSADPRPEPAPGSVTYRCGASIFIHKTEWRGACLKTSTPGQRCACNQPQEQEAAARVEGAWPVVPHEAQVQEQTS